MHKAERFADQCAQLVVIHLGQLDSHPAGHANVGRPKIGRGSLLDQGSLDARSGRDPNGDVSEAVVVIVEHGENPPRGEKGWLAVRNLFDRAGNRSANPANAVKLPS